ncbi:MAG TPA: 2-phospho-L-lactate transferase [Gammaproteobacteria bacterium]|nr:2-phospho-L-lactate transferase [Gammaproteobacteria bacterium]
MTGAVVVLSGGVGGAKFVLGLSRVLDPAQLTVIANTGDDFEHLGLAISPDIDTILYTLAGLLDPERGWGRRDETWIFMEALERLGGETWFRLGDGDLALHVERTRRLAGGATLSDVTAHLACRLGVGPRVLPMSDDPVRTRLRTPDGWLDFQDYFVRCRCEPPVHEIRYDGADTAAPTAAVLAALSDPRLRAIIIGPSNPLLSIGPILAIPGIRAALANQSAPVVAVSPIIAGQAIKGPAAKMMRELGLLSSAEGVARGYEDLIDAFVVDPVDAKATFPSAIRVLAAPALMKTIGDRERLAIAALAAADGLARGASV